MPQGQRDYLRQRKLLLGVLTLMGTALVYGILFGDQGIPRFLELRTTFSDRSAKVHQRVSRNAELRSRLQGLLESDEVLEEIARVHLGVVDENEIVYVFRPRDRDLGR